MGETSLSARPRSMQRWPELLRRYTAALSVQGLSPKTIRSYRYLILKFMADTYLWPLDADRHEIIAYLDSLPANGSSRGQIIRALKSLLRFAETEGLILESVLRDVTPKNPKLTVAPDLSEEELIRLFLAGWSREPKRGYAIIFAYCTGARRESLAFLEPRDVRLGEDPWVYFRVVKNDRPYGVPLGPLGKYCAARLLELAQGETVLGVGAQRIWQWVHQASLESGVKAWTHLLRHAYANAIETSADPRVWMDLMNHADLSQFPRYRHRNEVPMREAVAKL